MPWAMAGKFCLVNSIGAEAFRRLRHGAYINYVNDVLCHAGWHFSYLGDNEFVKRKLVSFSHASEQNLDYVNAFNMESDIYSPHSDRFIVKIDNYFPTTILNNLEKYQKYIATGAEKTIHEYYPNIPDKL
jgi:hypothetical protein